jgi:hypothetical protein
MRNANTTPATIARHPRVIDIPRLAGPPHGRSNRGLMLAPEPAIDLESCLYGEDRATVNLGAPNPRAPAVDGCETDPAVYRRRASGARTRIRARATADQNADRGVPVSV